MKYKITLRLISNDKTVELLGKTNRTFEEFAKDWRRMIAEGGYMEMPFSDTGITFLQSSVLRTAIIDIEEVEEDERHGTEKRLS